MIQISEQQKNAHPKQCKTINKVTKVIKNTMAMWDSERFLIDWV